MAHPSTSSFPFPFPFPPFLLLVFLFAIPAVLGIGQCDLTIPYTSNDTHPSTFCRAHSGTLTCRGYHQLCFYNGDSDSPGYHMKPLGSYCEGSGYLEATRGCEEPAIPWYINNPNAKVKAPPCGRLGVRWWPVGCMTTARCDVETGEVWCAKMDGQDGEGEKKMDFRCDAGWNVTCEKYLQEHPEEKGFEERLETEEWPFQATYVPPVGLQDRWCDLDAPFEEAPDDCLGKNGRLICFENMQLCAFPIVDDEGGEMRAWERLGTRCQKEEFEHCG